MPKLIIIFKSDYLNGFHNRKVERRKKANEEKKIKDKEARTLEKLQVLTLSD
jgi:hypothetical protein